ncbi:bifunctional methylenetetrahydrofolate dehydrogenase/methenyltetrahydrofolate cyclohydrolase FolD [Sporolactobacillus terrae]|uniref:Bifunctional protein FolD n=1 Tax=Sporolactobacillus terrae TaxID=269673 RepID=A0ABX5Q7W0_9BACL|nr:bifunctional methylenetetrahydrofolate dehydrogenase/methenyltetrahydrofolate cyclohydrolase FolD [Sporolactobacillus terrae]QAA22725.1 bifunctional methylenetetrahydrofolate dehydrogenase/methenyltetrahydrofolate cyclohydrolase FolD [Sporolactobacillus terrae]QAA25698.1 bifunctional methylenetetrahydrofolate dehydrogenase/methenyltetrahydrofolate cyclohydrolase FolD [Sporolactobacillus terrae]UAK17511.1 bifunctional methylenetetrahydrofolate dehydrogenase/methenyltetrahydrofolate cyclohydrol
MSAQLINGKAIAAEKRKAMIAQVELMKQKGTTPGLAVLLIGNHPASVSYVKGKVSDCQEVGIHSQLIRLPGDVAEAELLNQITKLNVDRRIHAILVQLPLPSHISEQKVVQAIRPEKDVDGFHPVNIGRIVTGQPGFVSCTPAGILEMLRTIHLPIAGKHVVIVGRSNIVGKPVSLLFLNRDATVTVCHSKSKPLSLYTKQADILIVAAGKASLIHADDIKPGAVVIDVGMNRNARGKLVGDVAFDEVKEKAGYLTPVPGGVGPMTRVMLLENTLTAAMRQMEKGL